MNTVKCDATEFLDAEDNSMTSHIKAHTGSRALCDHLVEALRDFIPDIAIVYNDDECALFQPGRNRFAHVYHRKDTDEIKVYFRGDLNSHPFDPSGALYGRHP